MHRGRAELTDAATASRDPETGSGCLCAWNVPPPVAGVALLKCHFRTRPPSPSLTPLPSGHDTKSPDGMCLSACHLPSSPGCRLLEGWGAGFLCTPGSTKGLALDRVPLDTDVCERVLRVTCTHRRTDVGGNVTESLCIAVTFSGETE